CPRQDRSVPLAECATCPNCHEIAADGPGIETCVRCYPEERPRVTGGIPFSGAFAESTSVGEVLQARVLCVATDLALPRLVALFVERGLPSVFVVDSEARVVGTIRDVDLIGLRHHLPLDAIMSSAKPVAENASIKRALVHMAQAHKREVPV